LDEYERYLQHHGDVLARFVHGDILRVDRNGFGEQSLHDSRVLAFKISVGESTSNATLLLRGPYFDRVFRLTYHGLIAWSVALPGPDDDLLVHEIRLDGVAMVHEIAFDHDCGFELRFQRLDFQELIEEASAPGSVQR